MDKIDIQEKIKELNELDRLYSEKKKEIESVIEYDFANNLNKTSDDKLKMFKYNVHNYYEQQNKQNSYYKENFPNLPFYALLLGGMLEDGCSDPTPKEVFGYENLINAFTEIFKEDKFKVTNSRIYQYNTETKEVIYSTKEWNTKRMRAEHDVFDKDPLKYTGSPIIGMRQCNAWQIGLGYSIDADVIIEGVKRLFKKYEEVHILKARIEYHEERKCPVLIVEASHENNIINGTE